MTERIEQEERGRSTMLQELSQEIEETARMVVNEVHTALPGEILFFDPKSGTASVRPVGEFVTTDRKKLAYPTVTEAPVLFPFCEQAGVGITFPIKKGDSCLIVVSEVELDAWRSGAAAEGSLRFDLSSAVVIPGLIRTGGGIIEKAVKQEAVLLRAPGVEISVSRDGVETKAGDTCFTMAKNSAQIEIGNTKLILSNGVIQAQADGMELCVSGSGIAVRGDLVVSGNLSYTGTCQQA